MAQAALWQPIECAPSGRDVMIRTMDGYTFKARYDAFDDGRFSWVATDEGKHPPCWTDGVCWEVNADYAKSDPPVLWRHLDGPRLVPSPPDEEK